MYAEDGVIPFPDAKSEDDVFCCWAYYDEKKRSAVIEINGPKRRLFVPVDFPMDDLGIVLAENKLEDVKREKTLDNIDFRDKLKVLYAEMTDEDKDWHRAEHKRRINRLQAYAKKVIAARKEKN